MGNAGYKEYAGEQLTEVLDLLEHYHCEHTTDKVTRFCGAGRVDVYVVSDPEWREKLRHATDILRLGG